MTMERSTSSSMMAKRSRLRASSSPRQPFGPPICWRELDPLLAADLGAIPHVSTAIVTLAYRRDEIAHPLPGHGYVVPRIERSPILACTWSSRKWEHRAPEGWELIRVFLGRSGQLQGEILNADDDTFDRARPC